MSNIILLMSVIVISLSVLAWVVIKLLPLRGPVEIELPLMNDDKSASDVDIKESVKIAKNKLADITGVK